MKYFVLTCKKNVWIDNRLLFIKDKTYDAVASASYLVTRNEHDRPHVIRTHEIEKEFKEHFHIEGTMTWAELCANPIRQKRVEVAKAYLNKLDLQFIH